MRAIISCEERVADTSKGTRGNMHKYIGLKDVSGFRVSLEIITASDNFMVYTNEVVEANKACGCLIRAIAKRAEASKIMTSIINLRTSLNCAQLA